MACRWAADQTTARLNSSLLASYSHSTGPRGGADLPAICIDQASCDGKTPIESKSQPVGLVAAGQLDECPPLLSGRSATRIQFPILVTVPSSGGEKRPYFDAIRENQVPTQFAIHVLLE